MGHAKTSEVIVNHEIGTRAFAIGGAWQPTNISHSDGYANLQAFAGLQSKYADVCYETSVLSGPTGKCRK